MRKTFFGMIALMMFAAVGMTSCEKDKTPVTPISTSSKALVGKWQLSEAIYYGYNYNYYGYCDITFNADGYGLFELYTMYDDGFELDEREMFFYTYYEEDGTLLIPYYSEFNDFLGEVIDVHTGDGGFDTEASSAVTIKSFTSDSFVLIDHKANSGKTLVFNRIN
jgi:hypothetical protein